MPRARRSGCRLEWVSPLERFRGRGAEAAAERGTNAGVPNRYAPYWDGDYDGDAPDGELTADYASRILKPEMRGTVCSGLARAEVGS